MMSRNRDRSNNDEVQRDNDRTAGWLNRPREQSGVSALHLNYVNSCKAEEPRVPRSIKESMHQQSDRSLILCRFGRCDFA
jgi:hypothetical protein